ncbi:RpiB/LacA/LacB family sugar-phosphate isomerase [Trueperella abortisuis]|uniref:Ribose 5-phosphate isomerase B n=1 Tax=Trueperella abortisuis TaxID=445930 RepID=A0ABT9PKJ5_9ACTO|nr:RpiB/LacA/LacB family sugar-phosphate isomerase [Trueperella abortisuis]MDP9833223.1 ribose 5-phosphate isomerase B [Trueperella abortisuis]
MKLAFGCDPNASELKQVLMAKATELGHEVTDLGSEDPIYANVAFDVATAVAAGDYDRGVLVCGTGIGVSIAANKVEGAYCACIHDVYQAERAVLSNNANLIAMGSQVIGTKLAEKLLEEYLKYTFDPNSRSKDKVNRICEFERGE